MHIFKVGQEVLQYHILFSKLEMFFKDIQVWKIILLNKKYHLDTFYF